MVLRPVPERARYPARVLPTASSTPGSGLSRRALLALGTAALAGAGSGALSGCDAVETVVRARPATADADPALVHQAVVALEAALDQVRRTLRRHHDLRTDLAPVLDLHTAHLAALRSPASSTASPTESATGTPTPAPAAPVPGRASAALRAVAAGEGALHARLTGLAQQARSGELARLLGAMAAGTSQRLAVWPA